MLVGMLELSSVSLCLQAIMSCRKAYRKGLMKAFEYLTLNGFLFST